MSDQEQEAQFVREEIKSTPVLTEELLDDVRPALSVVPDEARVEDIYNAFRSGAEFPPEHFRERHRDVGEQYPQVAELYETLDTSQRNHLSRLLKAAGRRYDHSKREHIYPNVGFIRESDIDTLEEFRGISEMSASFLKAAFTPQTDRTPPIEA